MTLAVLVLQVFTVRFSTAFAANVGDVVINEIAWAGTAADSNDEWIELYNPTSQSVDLSGWSITDDGTTVYTIPTGTIPARGYFLIEDKEEAVNTSQSGAVIGLSLANAGDSLVLKDAAKNEIDTVNASGGAWYAGNSTSKASMEKIDPQVTGDQKENWASAVTGNGAKDKAGADILGTPGTVNSNYGGSGPEIYLGPNNIVASIGSTVSFSVNAETVSDLYAYGFEINYDPTVLNFVEAQESDFLSTGNVTTSFHTALKNGTEGSLVVGNARLLNPPTGVDGSGKLFDLNFEVLATDKEAGEINFGAGSFLSDSQSEVQGRFSKMIFSIDQGSTVDPVSGLTAGEGDQRYSIKLNWNDAGAERYVVKRKMHNGNYEQIGETSELWFVDSKNIMPNLNYQYQVIAVVGSVQSVVSEIDARESRGLTGDYDRNDLVDGRDIEKLARAFGSDYGDEEYNALADSNFDGVIDGSDLIDVGINFGLQYS